jgi:pilus assembly protein CpaF
MFRRSAEVTPIGNRVADLTARRGRPLLPAAGAAPRSTAAPATRAQLDQAFEHLLPILAMAIDIEQRAKLTRGEIAGIVGAAATAHFSKHRVEVAAIEHRDLVTALMRELLTGVARPEAAPVAPVEPRRGDADRSRVESAKLKLQPMVVQRIDAAVAADMHRDEFEKQLSTLVTELLAEGKIQLNLSEQRELVQVLLADMLGLGPLETLLRDETITDIMVNGPNQTFVERRGKLELTDIKFRDNAHVLNIATRIVTRIGRRVDESSPLCDARLEDGSRVNIIIPPLAIDGPSISIRKFSKKGITLDVMAEQQNISPAMATVLKIAARCRLNILISGGTGSGKTTMLNALSRMIESTERTVTIEDAAELQLQQPHVVRLETRPANLEGNGEITMRDLLKNTLRMRPDRIILGEIRGSEALDVLQAMNTGHDGSMSTIHANRPREALTRLENMVGMAGINLPSRAVRTQISAAVHMIIQINRMRDGIRRVTHVMEIVGMEGDIITTQDLFLYQYQGEGPDGKLRGNFQSSGIRPNFLPRAEYFGLDRALLEAI